MKWLARKQDAEAFLILSRLPNLPFFSAIKPDAHSFQQSKEAFFANGETPAFTFSHAYTCDTHTYNQLIQKAEQQLVRLVLNDNLRQVYEEKLQELQERANLIAAIANRDDEAVTHIADALFTTPFLSTDSLITLLRTQTTLPNPIVQSEARINAADFKHAVQFLLDYYKIDGVHIRITDIESVKIIHLVRTNTSTILIPKHLSLTYTRAIKLLTHEIEGHVLRTVNGRNSPYALFARGLPNYSLTEEGIALHLQHSVEEARTNYLPGLLDSLGISIAMNTTFSETFDQLFALRKEWWQTQHQESKSDEELKEVIWRHMLRFYRGIHAPNKKGLVYSRDHMYFTGHEIVHQALNQTVSLRELFMGKVGLHHLPLFNEVNLDYVKVPEFLARVALER